MNIEEEFSDLGPEERTARCLELAQLALGRVEKSANEDMKELNLNVARCWHSLARQFATIKSLQERVSPVASEVCLPTPLAAVAATSSQVESFFDSLAPAGI